MTKIESHFDELYTLLCRVETHASASPMRLPPHQTGRADFPHPAFPEELRLSLRGVPFFAFTSCR